MSHTYQAAGLAIGSLFFLLIALASPRGNRAPWVVCGFILAAIGTGITYLH